MRHYLPLATALRQTLVGYSFSKFRSDLSAGFIVSMMALPLAMALSIAVGLEPEHGVYTAIIAGIVVPLLGGSIYQVTGPTAAFVVILAPIVSQYGLRGLIWSSFIASALLVLMGLSRLGGMIHSMPYPVVTGFTSGIAVVIATLSCNDFFGLGLSKLEGSFGEKAYQLLHALPHLNLYQTLIGLICLLTLFFSHRWLPRLPGAIKALTLSAIVGYGLIKMGIEISTLGSQFSYLTPEGVRIPGISPYLPTFHLPGSANVLFSWPNQHEFKALLMPGILIALLAALESLLSTSLADRLTKTKHNPNAELIALGVGNLLCASAQGIPATGAIARTVTNINNRATSPLAATFHGLFILGYILVLTPVIAYIPMASLAALMIYTAYRMAHIEAVQRLLRIAPLEDKLVLLVSFGMTIFVDMIAGVGIGLLLASSLAVYQFTAWFRARAKSNKYLKAHLNNGPNNENELEDGSEMLPSGFCVQTLSGPLLFANVQQALKAAYFVPGDCHTIIFNLQAVPYADITSLLAVKDLVLQFVHQGVSIHILCAPAIYMRLRFKLKDEIHLHKIVLWNAEDDNLISMLDKID